MIHMNNTHANVPVSSESSGNIDTSIQNINNTYIGYIRPAIYSFKIYDRSNNLIHDLIPVYGIVAGSAAPLFKDNITNKTYMGTGKGISDATYYVKN